MLVQSPSGAQKVQKAAPCGLCLRASCSDTEATRSCPACATRCWYSWAASWSNSRPLSHCSSSLHVPAILFLACSSYCQTQQHLAAAFCPHVPKQRPHLSPHKHVLTVSPSFAFFNSPAAVQGCEICQVQTLYHYPHSPEEETQTLFRATIGRRATHCWPCFCAWGRTTQNGSGWKAAMR